MRSRLAVAARSYADGRIDLADAARFATVSESKLLAASVHERLRAAGGSQSELAHTRALEEMRGMFKGTERSDRVGTDLRGCQSPCARSLRFCRGPRTPAKRDDRSFERRGKQSRGTSLCGSPSRARDGSSPLPQRPSLEEIPARMPGAAFNGGIQRSAGGCTNVNLGRPKHFVAGGCTQGAGPAKNSDGPFPPIAGEMPRARGRWKSPHRR
jgi:hypothetical protein